MNKMGRWLVWLSRIHHCRGFGIQSPTDYAFVRYVVNEHWPYYAYETLHEDDWLRGKLGRLYLRLANWRQPRQIVADQYERYWTAGCRTARIVDSIVHLDGAVELAHLYVDDRDRWEQLAARCDELSVVVVEGIYRNWQQWNAIVGDERTGVTFNLFYCGIVFFDKKRHKHNYNINF
ncbi:MAG: hypothetical protein IJ144_06150 [Prevotella sp.]|nr:hypothetical protein [Prevotella sp.]